MTLNILKIIAVIIVFISFGLFIRATDMQQVVMSVRLIGYNFIFLIFITFFAYWFATIGWKYCLGRQAGDLSVMHLFIIRHIGEMVSLVNPASVVGGESAKVYLLKNRGLAKSNIIASVLISRVMMAFTQLLLFLLAVTFVFFIDQDFFQRLPQVFLVFCAVFIISTIVIILFGRSHFVKEMIQKSAFHSKLLHFASRLNLKQVLQEFRLFFKTNKKGLAFCTLFFLLHWVIGSLEIYFILKFLGINTGVVQVLFVDMGIILFKSAGAFIPGQIGVEELGNKVMLDLIGIPDVNVWMTVSVLRRSRQLFWMVCGGIFYLIYHSKRKEPSRHF